MWRYVVLSGIVFALPAAAGAQQAEPEQQIRSAASGSSIVVEQVIANQSATLQGEHIASTANSFNDSTGVIGLNQSAGAGGNQANVQAVSIGRGAILNQSDSLVQRLEGNSVLASDAVRNVTLVDSFNNTRGLVGVNQSAGSFNNQANLVALSVGLGADAVAIGDSDLSQSDRANMVERTSSASYSTVLDRSFQNFQGVAQVSQVAGDLNQVANTVSIAVMPVGGM